MKRSPRAIELPKLTPLLGQESLAAVEPIAAAVAALLHPHAEIVLHDLATGRIARIWNNFSNRKVGEPSDLDADPELEEEDVLGPYEKASPRGERLNSISAVLRDHANIARAMLCINLDVSQFDAAAKLLAGFASARTSRPEWMFRQDIREQINLLIAEYLKARNTVMRALDQESRVDLISFLDRQGVFQTRRAVDHVAAALSLSRTTLYLLLKAARGAETKVRRK
jgi:predicted transcriptional regulator YheO